MLLHSARQESTGTMETFLCPEEAISDYKKCNIKSWEWWSPLKSLCWTFWQCKKSTTRYFPGSTWPEQIPCHHVFNKYHPMCTGKDNIHVKLFTTNLLKVFESNFLRVYNSNVLLNLQDFQIGQNSRLYIQYRKRRVGTIVHKILSYNTLCSLSYQKGHVCEWSLIFISQNGCKLKCRYYGIYKN